MEDNTPTIDHMDRIATSLERLLRVHVRLAEEVKEVRRELSQLTITIRDAHNL
jgi:hypothetical protein